MLWDVTCLVIREVIATTGVKPEDIAGVAVTSHGDGIYLVDEWGRPTRPGILSLDTRAAELVAGWERTGQSDTVLPLSGQKPWPGSPVSVLAWLARNEPDVMARTAYALPGKDAIKQRLTNVFSTDPTESSLSFTNVYSQEYDVETLRVFEVDELFRLLPEVIPSGRIAGEVTVAAAERCGLAPGTPVASGSHDVDCGAIGMGTVLPGQLAIIAGTFSINEVISDAARVDGRWNARNFVVPGQWMNMSLSPSSATNLEWFATRLAAHDVRAGGAVGDPFAFVEEDLRAIEASPSDLVYLPFLYGSPYTIDASAAFLGLRGWHERGHMVGAVMEGVVFNHRHHVDALRDGFDVTDIRLTGGAVNSGRWVQMFADTLATPVKVSNVREAGALGSAMLAGIAVGVYSDLPDAAAAIVAEPVVREPTPAGVARQEDNYRRYQRVIEAMTTVWTGSRGDPMTWIGTSWKMNKTLAEARAFVDGMVAARSVLRGVQTFVIPPHTAVWGRMGTPVVGSRQFSTAGASTGSTPRHCSTCREPTACSSAGRPGRWRTFSHWFPSAPAPDLVGGEMMEPPAEGRLSRQRARQRAIAADVMADGSVRIDALAEKHGISLMTAHRDLDALVARGIVRKTRGLVTALPSSLVEASDLFRRGQQHSEKAALARAACAWIEPGHAVILDDSTTTLNLVPLITDKVPLTVITNFLPIIEDLSGEPALTLIALGGQFHPWANSFMGHMTVAAIRDIRADIVIMSTSAITDDICFHQTQETVDTKRAMFESAAIRLLIVDHTKFERRALHALAPLTDFDHVIVDWRTRAEHVDRLKRQGIGVTVAPSARAR